MGCFLKKVKNWFKLLWFKFLIKVVWKKQKKHVSTDGQTFYLFVYYDGNLVLRVLENARISYCTQTNGSCHVELNAGYEFEKETFYGKPNKKTTECET